MGEAFNFLSTGNLIVKLPRRSPLMSRIIMLAVVMACSIYVTAICLKDTTIQLKHESTRAKQIDRHSHERGLVGLKKTQIQLKPELPRTKPIDERAYDPRVVLRETEINMKPGVSKKKPIEEHSYGPRIVALKQTESKLKSEVMARTKPMEDHSHDPTIVGLKQTDIQVKSDAIRTALLGKQPYDPTIIGLNQTKILIKPESVATKPIEQHSYVPAVEGLKQTKIENKSDPVRMKSRDQHPHDHTTVGLNSTKVLVKAELGRINLTKPACPDPGIPESEIPYVHYPVPTKYRRRECACTPVRFFVVLSMQRSGTKWLESFLNSHINISSNAEIFIDRENCANMTAITRELDKVYNLDMIHTASRSSCTAAVGFKWMLNQGIMENHHEVSKYFQRRGVSIIFLFRRNILRQMISLLANDQDPTQFNGEHKAHVISQHEADILASYKPKLNPKTLVSKLKQFSVNAAEAIEHFKGICHMVLYYEDLVQNNTQKLTEVMDFLRVPRRPLHSGHVKIHTRPISQMVRNWNAVRKALKGTQYENFLNT